MALLRAKFSVVMLAPNEMVPPLAAPRNAATVFRVSSSILSDSMVVMNFPCVFALHVL